MHSCELRLWLVWAINLTNIVTKCNIGIRDTNGGSIFNSGYVFLIPPE